METSKHKEISSHRCTAISKHKEIPLHRFKETSEILVISAYIVAKTTKEKKISPYIYKKMSMHKKVSPYIYKEISMHKKASPYIYEETSCGFGGVFTLSSDNNLTAVDKVDAFLEAGKGCGSLSHHAAVQIIDVGHVSVAVRQYGQPVGIIVGKVVVSSL